MSDYTFFSKSPGHWSESFQSFLGCHDICPLLYWFHVAQVTQSELTSLTHLKVWGDAKRFLSDVAFLLVLPKEGVAAEGAQACPADFHQAQLALCPGAAQWRCLPHASP